MEVGTAPLRAPDGARAGADRARRPRLSRFRWIVDLVLTLALAAAAGDFLIWRYHMLGRVGPAGWALFGLEVVSALWLVFTAVLLLGRTSPRQVPPEPPITTTLDVFIPVAGEPVEMVAETIAAAKAIDWPVNVVVCNDGVVAGRSNWLDIENLCRRVGVYCVTRLDGPKGKAANLNSALAWSQADAVLTIDADHQVVPDVAQQMLGYLRHEEIAFVTTPQAFRDGGRNALNPSEPVFYRAIQPARDRHGLAFSTGNGVLYRREALVRIGGFSEWSLVEDLHTSMRLHAAGWRSVYHPRPVTVGVAPTTAAEYARQRYRWALDSLRILRHDPPWRRRGLSWRAKVHYTHTTLSHVLMLLQVGFLLGPPAWILGRLSLLDETRWERQLLHNGPWLAMMLVTLVRWGGLRGALRTLRLSVTFLPVVFAAALWRVLRPGPPQQGSVTAKTSQARLNGMVVAGLAFPLGLLATLVWGVFDTRAQGSDLAMAWAAVLASLSIGPLLRFESRILPFLARSLVVVSSVALAAGSVATTRFGWEPPDGLYQSFRGDATVRQAVVATNELGDSYLAGPAVDVSAPSEPEPEPQGGAATDAVDITHPVGLEPAEDGIYLGYTSDEVPYDMGEVDRWASSTSSPQIVHWFQQWGSGDSRFRGDWIEEVAQGGRVPMISWEPWAKPKGGYRLAEQELGNMQEIADGRFDDYIDSWATAAAAHGQPILLRPFHEMNGFWYPWSVGVNGNTNASYIAGWRHVVDRFRVAGADNVSFVWSINTLAAFDQGRDVALAYPGDDYVDWVATSGFNWDDYASWASWVSAETVFGGTYEMLAGFDKPIMFSEIGTGKNGGDEAAWVRDAMAWFSTLDQLKAIMWFDRSYDGTIDFELGPGQRTAIKEAVDEPGSAFAPTLDRREHPQIDPAVADQLSAVTPAPPADRIDAAVRAGEDPVVIVGPGTGQRSKR